jgi:hypothetical protein
MRPNTAAAFPWTAAALRELEATISPMALSASTKPGVTWLALQQSLSAASSSARALDDSSTQRELILDAERTDAEWIVTRMGPIFSDAVVTGAPDA